jgi:hypothetical protein
LQDTVRYKKIKPGRVRVSLNNKRETFFISFGVVYTQTFRGVYIGRDTSRAHVFAASKSFSSFGRAFCRLELVSTLPPHSSCCIRPSAPANISSIVATFDLKEGALIAILILSHHYT